MSGPYVPLAAKQMYALGPRTEAALDDMFRIGQGSLFGADELSALADDDFEFLGRALLSPRWSDEQAEILIRGIAHRRAEGAPVDVALVGRWVLSHPNDAEAVILCMSVEPPSEVEIRRALPRTGSQKEVFLATWRLTQREVVVKRLLRPDSTASRELQSFPLNLSHPNIIETHRLQNRHGELFLLEEYLSEVLNDRWRASGVQEAANLVYDVGSAVRYLHDNNLVHGDIKPDNIGKRQLDFVLLDFGICRPSEQFSREATATGSLRTRAPELLATDRYEGDPREVDVWALGATVFATLTGRFPLIGETDRIPRVSDPDSRATFEAELARRASQEWDRWVDLTLLPDDLQPVLAAMLEREPRRRVTSAEVLEEVERSLSALIRGERAMRDGRFSPLEELNQIQDYLRSLRRNTSLPSHRRAALRDRLRELESTQGFAATERNRARSLAETLL